MSDKKSVTVQIYGNEYTLKGDADPNYIADLARYVDGKMNDIGKKSSAPAAKVAILASMNIADEYHRAERSREEAQKLLEVAERNLLDMRQSSEGSLIHSMDLKKNLEKTSGEAAEVRRALNEVKADSMKILENSKKALEDAQADAELAKMEWEDTQKALDKSRAESDQLRREVELARREAEEAAHKASEEARREASEKIRVKDQEMERVRTEALQSQEGAAQKAMSLSKELEQVRAEMDAVRKEADAAKRAARERAESGDIPKAREEALLKQVDASASEIHSLKTLLSDLQSRLEGKKAEASKSSYDQRIQEVEASALETKKRLEEAGRESTALKAELEKAQAQLKAAQDELKVYGETAAAVEPPQLSFLAPPDQMETLLRRIDAVLEVR